MKRSRRNSMLIAKGRRAVKQLIAAQERIGCKLLDLEIVGDNVIVKADYIMPIAEKVAEMEAAGMSHEDAVQWGVRALRRRTDSAEGESK